MNILKLLCDTLGMSKSEIISFAQTAPHRYKKYRVLKRNGIDFRIIAHPSKELKFIQRILVDQLVEVLPIHKSSFAYKIGLSIKDNAIMHVNSKYLLKMDFKDFFPSITPELLFFRLQEDGIKISDIDKNILEKFIFWRAKHNSPLRLSIGAPSSPLISNYIMFKFDDSIHETCKIIDVTYTRYADDITFSSKKEGVMFDLPLKVAQALDASTNSSIKINNNKTIFSSKAHNRHVTGVTLTNDNKLSLGRNRKRLLSSMIHKYKNDVLQQDDVQYLKGMIAHAKHIEPDFYFRMSKKYGNETIEKLMKEKK